MTLNLHHAMTNLSLPWKSLETCSSSIAMSNKKNNKMIMEFWFRVTVASDISIDDLIAIVTEFVGHFEYLPELLGTMISTMKMEQSIEVFNIARKPISLPYIAVIGSQSVGKSSVLESIIGIGEFLPKGNSIITRRPLIIQLINTATRETWGEFMHSGSKKYHCLKDIRTEIENETERVAPNRAISYYPMNLRIHTPNVPEVTVIDVPGLDRVAWRNSGISRKLHKLTRAFIVKKNCLIIAVSQATAYLPTSQAIEQAKAVDPEGLRTIGVMTKIDLMDKGTDAVSILKNEVVPLKYGYIGMINKSQKDIINEKSLFDSHQDEKEFFENDCSYHKVSDRCGVQSLCHKLCQVMVDIAERQLRDEFIKNQRQEIEVFKGIDG